MTPDKGPRPYHVATEKLRFPKDDGRLGRALAEKLRAHGFRLTCTWEPPASWTEPKYPGDSMLRVDLVRGDELGDVRVQWYDDTTLKVGAFLPGVTECSPGDTPKTWPEKFSWVTTKDEASKQVVQFLIAAYRDGWSPRR